MLEEAEELLGCLSGLRGGRHACCRVLQQPRVLVPYCEDSLRVLQGNAARRRGSHQFYEQSRVENMIVCQNIVNIYNDLRGVPTTPHSIELSLMDRAFELSQTVSRRCRYLNHQAGLLRALQFCALRLSHCSLRSIFSPDGDIHEEESS